VSEVTRDGVVDERPGRDATVGSAGGRHAPRPGEGEQWGEGRRRRRGRRGEALMVPRAKFTSYYGRPVIKRPVWQERDIAGYFFLGGLAGASSVLAAGASLTGRPALARGAKVGAATAIGASLAALVHDLGRPARFVNMLRVVKPTSPMSMGTWLLSAYAPAAFAAAASDVTGRLPRVGALATAAAAVTGPAVATYTAVLAADTAVPAWHDAHRELPFVFAGSATCAAAGLGLLAAPTAQSGPARRAAVLGAACEAAATHRMRARLGSVRETYETGSAGSLMRAAEGLTVGGAAVAAVLGGRSRRAAGAAGAALLAGSACTRFGVFRAGLASADDPRYTVEPQRARLEARDEQARSVAGLTSAVTTP
jgi:formate-dependent nitrite reductase membrane component NrfD